jgi:hypothetical protein
MRSFFILCACMGSYAASLLAAPEPSDAKALGKELMGNLSGIFSIDDTSTEKLGEYSVPALKNGNWIIKSQPMSLIDSFSQETHTVSTFFIKVDDEFVRVSTTEENEKAGNILSHSSPAYKRLLGELRYTDKVVLSGKEYMADYDVFRDRQGRVIGAYLVAIPVRP